MNGLFFQEILPLRDMLEQATNYVVELKQNVEELKRRKVELEGDNKVGSQDERLPVLTIRDMDSILEVNLIAGLNNNLKLHEVLSVLKEEGVEVESASYSSVGNQAFYTIHCKLLTVQAVGWLSLLLHMSTQKGLGASKCITYFVARDYKR
ncbi:hypothetical protein ACSBR2_036186 [Camellia fascicularis]